MRSSTIRNAPRTLTAAAATAVVGGLLVAGPLVTGAADAAPKPTVSDVKKAYRQLEKANEDVNAIEERAGEAKADVADLDASIDEQMKGYRAQRDALGSSIVQQQRDAPLGPSVSLLGSKDASDFIDGLGAMQSLNNTQADRLERFARTKDQLDNRREQLAERRADLKKDLAEATERRDAIESRHEKLEAQVKELSTADQAELNPPSQTTLDPGFDVDVKANGRAKDAVDFAAAQLGDPYVYGGTGPDGWDCSGLVQGAWAAAGVSLPRVVGPQYGAVKHIAMSDLQPGDIVFYPDMSHDGLYIGGGQVIHAPRPGRSVEVTSVSYGFTLAGRVA